LRTTRSGGTQLAGAAADFDFEASAAEGAVHAVIGEEEGFGALFLGAGAFDAGDDAQGKARISLQFPDDLLKKVNHKRGTGSQFET
jgi:hypothetical protein